MELKHCNRDACVAVWSNSKAHGELLACASINQNNQNLYDLQILSVDLANTAKTLNIEGKSIYNNYFRCLAWGTFGEKQGTLPYGLIFGGMQNGSFSLWNPADMIGKFQQVPQSNIDEQKSFIYAEEAPDEIYPIICAEWNPLKNNFLAYGGLSLLILDVAKDISNPDILKPSSNNPHAGSCITSVRWNKEVAHILASADNNGLIALYDIKTNKSIFTFKDNSTSSSQDRQVQIAWSKHISTQIAVTLDDEKKNQLQIWDLRNQKGPIVVIDKGHTKGINTMDWSQLDHDLILTGGRDHRIVCWNYRQDQQPLSIKQISADITKVAWSKALPSIYSVTTIDGISICSLDDRNIHSYIPKWLKVPVSSTFNGNDNLITYSEERGNTMNQYTIKSKPDEHLLDQIAVLQEFIEHGDVESLKDFEGEIGEFWKLISTKKNQEGDSDIYDFLGLNKDKIIKEVEKYTGKKRQSISQNNSKSSKQTKNKVSKADYIPVSGFQAADFFGSLSCEPQEKSIINAKNQDQNESENIKYDMVPRNYNWDIGKQKLIKQNMLIGNYQGAIDAALKCGRTAEALIIAFSIDPTTFNSTLKTFFTETTDNFISGILRHIAFKDSEQLVKKYNLDKWKQCVALIFSRSSADKRKVLLSSLAKRLQTQSQAHQEAAIYCYILAEEFEQIVDIYQKRLNEERVNSKERKVKLITLGTRLLAIYSCFNTQIKSSNTFQRFIRELALVCLEANKKILSYTLFTKYLSQSSSRYIEYLIHNTQELSEYRNLPVQIIQLPIMNKRQEKIKKNTKNLQQEVPTNIKPNPNIKQPKLPTKTPFNEPQPQVVKNLKPKGGVTPPPPPPPPPFSHNRGVPTPINIVQEKSKTNLPPPPPPPGKRTQPFQQGDNQGGDEQRERQTHQIPKIPTIKNKNPPPPPPPAKSQKNLNTSTSYQQNQYGYQNPSQNKRQPPPPPENNPVSRPTLPSFPTHQVQGRTPPPPPPHKKQVVQQQQQTYEEHNTSTKRNPPPPPPVKSQTMPPPPMKTPTQLLAKNIAQTPLPPPVSHNVPQEKHYEQKYQQGEQPTQRKLIQPPPIKKNVPPPPPLPSTKQTPRADSQVSEQTTQNDYQQQNTSFQSNKRGPPPPPQGRKVPPPPPGRK